MKLRLLPLVLLSTLPMFAQSVYPTRPKDAEAVDVVAKGDGVADDSAALQKAIDTVAHRPRMQGIVFLRSGRYRISRTIFMPPGVRLIGYGAERPVLFLGAKTPGFQSGMGYMIFFSGGSSATHPAEVYPGTVPLTSIADANPGTFYSALSNVDIEIGDGNPAAVGVRFHVAQHSFLAHMDFRLGSGLAGIHDVGNEAEDLHFHGGTYGIITKRPSPGWQFTLLDSSFDGQREAAIKEHEAGLTLVRDSFRDVPRAIVMDAHFGEELWVKETRFENVSGPAITIAEEKNARTEINLEDDSAANVPTLVRFLESGKTVAGAGPLYRIKRFTHGYTMRSMADEGKIATQVELERIAAMPAVLPPAIRPLPAESTWVNVRDLGAKGDAKTDDTAAFQRAIAEHSTIYVPEGYYLVSDTLALRPDTVLIALHPSRTQIFLSDGSAAFNGTGEPKALLVTPQGGSNILSGIGLSTNGINHRAVGVLWQAGANSLMSDVRLLGGHGTQNPDGSPYGVYNANRTGDPDPNRKWDTQYPSIWVTNGGGGVFSDIWTPNSFSQAGFYVSGTTTPGRVYELSIEHHVRNEFKLDHAANWEIYALQVEEERGEGGFCLPVEVSNAQNITFANFHSYRVISSYQPYPTTIRVTGSSGIRFRNVHIYSNSKASFDNAVVDEANGGEVRQREIASLDIVGTEPRVRKAAALPVFVSGPVAKLADGFFNTSGGAVDPKGTLYFTDLHTQHIERWNAERREVEVVRDAPIGAVNLAFDRAGNMMVVSYDGNGTVYSMRPDAAMGEMTQLQPQPVQPQPGKTAVLAANNWRSGDDAGNSQPATRTQQYMMPDGVTFLPVADDFVKGTLIYNIKMADVLRSFGLNQVQVGKTGYLSSEAEHKTFSGTVAPDGSLAGMKVFTERGGEGATTDVSGNVYIAEGQVYVYRADGTPAGVIEVPERPTDLVFGGADRKTLYILTRTSLYATRLK